MTTNYIHDYDHDRHQYAFFADNPQPLWSYTVYISLGWAVGSHYYTKAIALVHSQHQQVWWVGSPLFRGLPHLQQANKHKWVVYECTCTVGWVSECVVIARVLPSLISQILSLHSVYICLDKYAEGGIGLLPIYIPVQILDPWFLKFPLRTWCDDPTNAVEMDTLHTCNSYNNMRIVWNFIAPKPKNTKWPKGWVINTMHLECTWYNIFWGCCYHDYV